MKVMFNDDKCKVKFGSLHVGDVFLGHCTGENEDIDRSIYMKMHKVDSDYNAVNVRTGWQYYFGDSDNVVQLDAYLDVRLTKI